MKKRLLQLLACVVYVTGSTAALAGSVLTPTSLPGGAIVEPQRAFELFSHAVFFDMRKALNYGKGHIQGAIPLPYQQKSEKLPTFDASIDHFDLAKLPNDKNAPIVFYSDGPTGWKSYKAAVTSIQKGYSNVYWMRDGFPGWRAAGYPVE